MKLVNMLMRPKKSDIPQTCCESKEILKPRYPYGLQVSLNNDSLKRLDLSGLDLSKSIEIHAYATVKSANLYLNTDGTQDPEVDSNLSLQITDIALSNKQTKRDTTNITLRSLKNMLTRSE